jgi:hypothetical protein
MAAAAVIQAHDFFVMGAPSDLSHQTNKQMKPELYTISLAIFLIIMTGCLRANPDHATAASHTDVNLITRYTIAEYGISNAYDAVDRLKSHWLRTKGIDSFTSPTQIQVYMDNTRLGGIATLRTISSVDIAYIRYIPPQDAAARWGFDHGQGVIFVSTRPE